MAANTMRRITRSPRKAVAGKGQGARSPGEPLLVDLFRGHAGGLGGRTGGAHPGRGSTQEHVLLGALRDQLEKGLSVGQVRGTVRQPGVTTRDASPEDEEE